MTHLHLGRLRTAMTAAGLDVAALATASGVRSDFIDDALDGRRRLGVAAMEALAAPLGVNWTALRCDHDGGRTCPGCTAENLVTAADLADAADAIATLLTQAKRQRISDLDRLAELPGFAPARAALVAVGGDLDPRSLASVGAGTVLAEGNDSAHVDDIGMRLATYCAGGDVDTDEIVGLDIDGDIPNGLAIAGWNLVCFGDVGLRDYEVVPGCTPRTFQSWDRIAASHTWWLRRPAGMRTARSGGTFSIADPADAAIAPRLTLALLKNEPPRVLSHGWAQRGRGVSLGVTSRELDYIVEDDGYPSMQYGPYYVDTKESARWADHARHVGDLTTRVFATNTGPAKRYTDAAEQFLGVAADLYYGWNPLPRLALEMCTVAEMLLLSSGSSEDISRRVRIAAAWLGGIDDTDRDVIHEFAKKLYDAGSKYRHGDTQYTLHRGDPVPTGRKTLDVLRAYRLLRRLMRHGLAVVEAGESPADLCDRAQRTDAARDRLGEIVSNLYTGLKTTPRRFPPA